MNDEKKQAFVERHNRMVRYRTWLKWINLVITGTVYLAYPAFLIRLFIYDRSALPASIIVPGTGFVLLSAIRYLINAPRPYEVYGVPPVISKETKGKSFPSRHVFSIFIIAVTMGVYRPVFGIVIGLLGVILAAVRVLSGVHFLIDVVVGGISAIIYGVLLFGFVF